MVIYKITNKLNNKIYVGQRKFELEDYYGSGRIIQRAVDRYGKENFTVEVLEECSEETANERETFWIRSLRSFDREIGYNISDGAFGGDTISNNPDREEIVSKISKASKKRYEEGKCSEAFHKSQGSIAERGVYGEYTCSKCQKTVKGKSNYLRYHEENCGKRIEQVTCPHCGKTGRKTGMVRWHFDNCKQKKL